MRWYSRAESLRGNRSTCSRWTDARHDLGMIVSINEGSDGLPMPQVSIQGPEMSRLADLNSIFMDVALAQRMALRYLDLLPDSEVVAAAVPEEQQTELTALWRAALISYRRAFSSGRALLVKQGSRLRLCDADLAHLTD